MICFGDARYKIAAIYRNVVLAGCPRSFMAAPICIFICSAVRSPISSYDTDAELP